MWRSRGYLERRLAVGSFGFCALPVHQHAEHNSALQKLCGAPQAIWIADLQSALLAFAHLW